ncbi:FecR family protein [Maribellus luteus]|uniref:FecR family protein n=1 Tax=Maribellus luteus TaxID=2305463 RepID=A0A399T5D5_9BACT|nr:FecR family protein [Maribellus luteus]RIJ50002.1 FecR family protein [Maribellus luteus]
MGVSNIYISLVIKYLGGEIDEVQKKKLFEWVYATPANEKLFYNLKDIWETARYESITRNTQTDKEWDKFISKAIKEETKSYNRRLVTMQVVKKVLQIAAIIIITFGIGFYTKNLIPQSQEYTTLNVPYGAKTQLELADGSKIWVNSGSKLTYPTKLNEKEVNIFLEGEAYFDIVKDKSRKLNVKTSTISIQVIGTAFNVKSYENEDIVETTLVRGEISILGKVGNKSINHAVVLKPNQQATLVKGKQNIQVNEVQDEASNVIPDKVDTKIKPIQPALTINEEVDVIDFTSWKNNKLVFKSERFEDLAIKIERWYNVRVIWKDEELKNTLYTGVFEKETIEQALHALSLSSPFKYQITKNEITITKD